MKVWLLGASGLLGRALAARCAALGVDWTGTGAELDVTDGDAVRAYARAVAPTVILNAAAYTRVDAAETDEAAAFRVNALGPEHLGRAAAEVGADVVHYSTDYVFDGTARLPYPEDASPAPLGAYGRTKLEGERRLLAARESGGRGRALVIRTSWLFGDQGPSFVATMLELMRQREEVGVVDDQRGCPTYAADLAAATFTLLRPGLGADQVLHFANSGETTWHGLAREVLTVAHEVGLPLACRRVVPLATADVPRPAPRPRYSVLDTTRVTARLGAPPRPWTTALREALPVLARCGV